jgi:hypothetical protein
LAKGLWGVKRENGDVPDLGAEFVREGEDAD